MNFFIVGSVVFDVIEIFFGKIDKIIGGVGIFIVFLVFNFMDSQGIVLVVGEDFFVFMLLIIQLCSVNFDGLQIKQGEKIFFWLGCYHNDMNLCDMLIIELNVLEYFDLIILK